METLKGPCGHNYLHQQMVEATWRDREDGDGTTYESRQSGHSIHRKSSKAIPGRRDVMKIHFFCEECAGTHILRVMQHKGQTLMEWQV